MFDRRWGFRGGLLLVLCSIFWVTSCGFWDTSSEEYREIEPLDIQTDPFGVRVFHASDDTSCFYLRITPKTQYFAFGDSGRVARLMLKVTLSSDQSMAGIIQSEKHAFTFRKGQLKTDSIYKASFPLKANAEAYLEVRILDEVSGKDFKTGFSLHKTPESPRNLMLTRDRQPVFENFITPSIKYRFRYKNDLPETLYLFRASDTAGGGVPITVSCNAPLSFRGAANYEVCRTEGRSKACFILPVMRIGFPKVLHKEHMVEPLQLLMDTAAYSLLTTAYKPAAQAELFWLSLTQNNTHLAGKLIEVFYRRYEYANTHYTHLQAGWSTDIGRTYLLFGYPSRIIDEGNMERWSYGFSASSFPYDITFAKKMYLGRFRYALQPDDTFYEMLHLAKLYWQQGIVFSDERIKSIQYEKEEDQRQSAANPWGALRY